MDWKTCIKHKPWLKPFDRLGLNSALLAHTKGNAFVVFNMILGCYELHTVEAYLLSGDSINVTLSEEQMNGFLVHDFRANDFARYAEEMMSDHMVAENDVSRRESNRDKYLAESLKSIERAMGTRI